MKRPTPILLLLLLLCSTSLYPQTSTDLDKCCSLDREFSRIQQTFGTEVVTPTKTQKVNPKKMDMTKRIIPLVFHIVRTSGCEDEPVDMAQIGSAVKDLNADFSATNEDRLRRGDPFFEDQADMGIEFRLADYDIQGNRTSGVLYYTLPFGYSLNDLKRIHAWDRSKYLNVWVVDEISGASGYAFYPETVDNLAWLDGITMDKHYLGTIGYGATKGVIRPHILAHEVGHWLSLKHAWGDVVDDKEMLVSYLTVGDSGNCRHDDLVGDTPNTEGSASRVSVADAKDDDFAVGCTEPSNIFNTMDYGIEVMFTNGQKNRAYQSLNSPISQRNEIGKDTSLFLYKSELNAVLLPVCTSFLESQTNNGTISQPCIIELQGGCDSGFKSKILPSDYTVENLPKGYSVRIVSASSSIARFYLVGKGRNHEKADNVRNISVTFKQSAFKGLVPPKRIVGGICILYLDKYEIKHNSYITGVGKGLKLEHKIGRWKGFRMDGLDWMGVVGAKNDEFYLYTESGQPHYAACYKGTNNILRIENDAQIKESTYAPMGSGLSGDRVVFKKKDWAGKSGYAYIRIEGCGEKQTRFAWVYLSFTRDFKIASIYEAAYDSEPLRQIKVGYRGAFESLSFERVDIRYPVSVEINDTKLQIKDKEGGLKVFERDTVSIRMGASYRVVLKPKSNRSEVSWYMWIDFNGNGYFGDLEDLVLITEESKGNFKGSIEIVDNTRENSKYRGGVFKFRICPNYRFYPTPHGLWNEGGVFEGYILLR